MSMELEGKPHKDNSRVRLTKLGNSHNKERVSLIKNLGVSSIIKRW
jgi:hypothetical protein